MPRAQVTDGFNGLSVLDPDERPVRLASLWADRPVVLAFVRHFG